jgi:hypothetical protein
MFARRARSLKGALLGQVSFGLTTRHLTGLKDIARYKHTGLFGHFLYDENKSL